MSDTTTDRPDFETLDISSKTVAFACLELDVAELIGSIRWDAASILNWRLRSSALFVHQVLMRMGGEFSPFELSGADFARTLWPDLPTEAGKDRISKLIAKTKEDQRLSGFEMVWIDSKRTRTRDDGSFYRLPTLYKPADFPALFRAVQDAAIDCDLCKMSLGERQARQRSIIETYLFARGCKRIEPGMRSTKTPKKSATTTEESGADKMKGRVTKQDVERRMSEHLEGLFDCGIDWANLGLYVPDYWRKINSGIGIIDQRVADAVKRSNKPGLKLVGGQPK